MKPLIRITLILFVLAMSGCKDFLNEPLQGTYSNATFYKTEAHALLAITGVYNAASFVSTENNLWVFGDVASDDATKGGLAGDQSDIQFIDEFNYARNNASIEKVWKRYYEGISRANYLLYYGPTIDMDVSRRNRILAEAKFLRAYFYFNLVNIFGEIPIKLNPPLNPDDINKPTSSVALVYAQIEKDLKEAIAVLPRVFSGSDLGRAPKGAAWGLLAKTYLYQQQWQSALTAIDSINAIGIYSLQRVYKNNFIDSTQNNTESLFEIQHISGQSPKLDSYLNQYFSPSKDNGYFFDAPLKNFVDEFEKTASDIPDPRLDYSVGRKGQKWVNGEEFDPIISGGPQPPAWSPTGYLSRKHVQPKKEEPLPGYSSMNYVYMRYADVLLMKAEALNELGRGAEAQTPLNAVRKRARESYLFDKDLTGFGAIPAGLLPDVVTANQTNLRTAIQHERRVELGLEFHRYFDLMRYGKQTAEAALGSAGFNYDKRYFTIPQSELDTNPAITK